MTLGTGASPTLAAGSIWRLLRPLPGWSSRIGSGLATEVAAGRRLRLLEDVRTAHGRVRVRLLEDGYPCWLEIAALRHQAEPCGLPTLPRLPEGAIAARLPQVLGFAEQALGQPNRYLWGGTLGPDFDCSGLVQTAFAQAGIWLPRDAYLQERFCRPVAVRAAATMLLRPGDLLFFGTPRRCTHVALHLGEGRYLHSSGREHGRDGLGVDDLHPSNPDPVAGHYRAELRGAGRVIRSHDGSPQPD